MPNPAPTGRSLQLCICAAEHKISKKVVPRKPGIGIDSKLFFRVPDALKTTYIGDTSQQELIRQAAFFLRDVIAKNQESLFLRRLTFKWMTAYYPNDDPPTIKACTRVMVAIIWEIEWAFWTGRGKFRPHAPWNVFFGYNTEEWNYNMAPVLIQYSAQQAAARLEKPGPTKPSAHKDAKPIKAERQVVVVPDGDDADIAHAIALVIPDDEEAVQIFGMAPTIGAGTRFNPYNLVQL